NRVSVEVHATDIEALLVEWMNEVLYALDDEEACVHAVRVTEVGETELMADVEISACGGTPEATELKAATYHQLSVRKTDTEWEATVFFDV
ncbi:MAG TPA: archease, partial [Actinomycetota bacterium]|nr:archease [Actinomycetota bacterium]